MTDLLPNQEPQSKSARKREMQALQEMGTVLLGLPADRLAEVPLSDTLRDALALAQHLKQREARRRHLQYIGKLMRQEDTEAISAVLQRFTHQDRFFRQHFHRLEQLRDTLIEKGDVALAELLAAHPHLDTQHLRQLVRQARHEVAGHRPPAAARKLFRYLQDSLDLL